ncbi:MAG: carboxypeptidase-like regulatory domain-containing protein [Puia sp.]|nr:carboxypeptidase-like regulatory domain-containing protein [Puia sp.]
MKKVLSFPILLLVCLSAFTAGAQTNILTGIIKDSANGKPLAGVSVFLNGTSKGTVTRSDGTFVLQFPQGRYELIVSAIGYATYSTGVNSHNLPPSLNIILHTSADELAAITVEPFLKDGWKKYGRTFLQYFIGTTDNANHCTIKNKEVLRFHYYLKSRQLAVTATDPLLIENKALGYELEYRLERFVYDMESHIISYFGYPLFRDMPTTDIEKKKKWADNRQLAYMGSRMHFMRSLYNHRAKEEGFIIKYKMPVPNTEKQRVKKLYQPNFTKTDSIPMDTLHHYWDVLREPDYFMQPRTDPDGLMTILQDQTHVLFFYEDCTVIYGNPRRGIAYTESSIRLMNQQPVAIDENGSFYPQNEVLNLQNWSITENMSNLLPRDYDINVSVP